jgi:hypothetical protein
LGRLGLIGSVEVVDVRRQLGVARMEQGHPLARVKTGRRGELQHRKAEGGERPRLNQAKAETLHSGEGLGTAAQHHDLARLEPAPSLATGARVAGRAATAAAGWRRDTGSAGAASLAAAAVPVVAIALAIAIAVIAAIALAVPIALAIAIAVIAAVALAVPLPVAIALAIAVSAAVAVSIPMAALGGEGRGDQAVMGIGRAKQGAGHAQGQDAQDCGGQKIRGREARRRPGMGGEARARISIDYGSFQFPAAWLANQPGFNRRGRRKFRGLARLIHRI